MKKEGWTWEDMDLSVKKGMIPSYRLFTVIGLLFLVVRKYGGVGELGGAMFHGKIFLVLFITLCCFQVFCVNDAESPPVN